MNLMKKSGGVLCLLLVVVVSQAQRTVTMDEAIQLGLQNSKQLKRSQNKIDESLAQLAQAKDRALPSAKASFQYLHALMLARTVNIPGLTQKAMELNFDFPAYIGTLSVSEPIFAGNQLKYARRSADLMVQMSRLDAEKDRGDIAYLVIESYINYDKILQNQLIVVQNMQDIQDKLDQITKYESQGLATQNDVLRFQLEKSRMQLTEIGLEDNRKVANYNLNILLGLPDSTQIIVPPVDYKINESPVFDDLLRSAQGNRREVQDLSYQTKLADINARKVHDQRLPTLGASFGAYYINPTGNPFPTGHTVLAPLTLGIGVNWDIGTLYTNKHKEQEAAIQREDLNTARDQVADELKKEVYQKFIAYQRSLDNIKVLQVAIDQASENERILESKFKNNLATTTDRIDAQTLLYQSRVNLELAKSDATVAWYDLQHSAAMIQTPQPQTH
jgi:outer membrane protein TolC